ncbi:hypothetical protein EHP00_1819 [Ecytonucleospora hepatopenaei]|uniref:Uncharacterized protein n=1 Tax=Ecytonucleospora hepatopenaei TaxID=646526 RepID=A0A1W0E2P7_9MICR|nr:hypothetical protein EHP00_1819 [Ecytonucleospora hepatopenaei]
MSNGILSVKALLPVLRQSAPKCFLQMWFQYVSYFDFFLVFTIIAFTYFIGTSMKYVSGIALSFLIIKNFFGSHSSLAVEMMENSAKNSFFEKPFAIFSKVAQNEFGAITLAIISGVIIAKASAVTVMVGLVLTYISYFTNLTDSEIKSTWAKNVLFVLGVTIPALFLLLVYQYIDVIFGAFSNAALSTFFAVWYIDKNAGLSFTKNSMIETIVTDIGNGEVLSLTFLLLTIFITLSMVSQVVLYEPAVEIYYIIKTKIVYVKDKIKGNAVELKDNKQSDVYKRKEHLLENENVNNTETKKETVKKTKSENQNKDNESHSSNSENQNSQSKHNFETY